MKKAIFAFNQAEKTLLKQLSVSTLVLFGSQAQGHASAASDFDFGIIVKDKRVLRSFKKRKEIYNKLYDLLSSKIKKLVNIDIVFLENAPSELQEHVIKYGMVLFEGEKGVFADFKQYIMEQSADFAPIKKIFHEEILGRIN